MKGGHALPVLHFRIGAGLQHDPDQLGIPRLSHQHQWSLALEVGDVQLFRRLLRQQAEELPPVLQHGLEVLLFPLQHGTGELVQPLRKARTHLDQQHQYRVAVDVWQARFQQLVIGLDPGLQAALIAGEEQRHQFFDHFSTR
ncbi:hypothetical protein D3C85_1487370 [compost metagenome]